MQITCFVFYSQHIYQESHLIYYYYYYLSTRYFTQCYGQRKEGYILLFYPSYFTSFFLVGQVVFVFGLGHIHFLGYAVFVFWVRLSSFFGLDRICFLGQVVLIFWVRLCFLVMLSFFCQVVLTFQVNVVKIFR